jgi:hypothetical protein
LLKQRARGRGCGGVNKKGSPLKNCLLVELQGVEPWSRQADLKLSTCLAVR